MKLTKEKLKQDIKAAGILLAVLIIATILIGLINKSMM